VESARKALLIVDKAKDALDAEMRELTNGAVSKCSEVAKLTRWLEAMGVAVTSLAKADIDELLDFDDLPGVARQALLIRQEAAKTSTAKLATMLARASKDGRVRGEAIYHAAGTGRTQSAGVNLNNLPRPRKMFDDAKLQQDVLFQSIREGDPSYLRFMYGDKLGRPLHLLSDSIRGFIWAATKQIEAPQGAIVYFSLLLRDLTLGNQVKIEQFSIYGVGRYPHVVFTCKLSGSRIVPTPAVGPDNEPVGEASLGIMPTDSSFTGLNCPPITDFMLILPPPPQIAASPGLASFFWAFIASVACANSLSDSLLLRLR